MTPILSAVNGCCYEVADSAVMIGKVVHYSARTVHFWAALFCSSQVAQSLSGVEGHMKC